MTIKLGSTDINKLYLGSTEIKKAYLGSNLFYDKTGGTPTTGWSQTNAGSLGLVNAQSCSARLNSTSVCILNQTTENLEVYNSTTLVQRGSGQALAGTLTNDNWVARLTDNEVIASHNGTVWQKYVWDDVLETWATEGSSINLSDDTIVIGASSTRFFAFRRLTSAGVSCWDLSGGTWSQTGSTKSYSTSTRRQAIAILDRTADAEVLVVRTYQTAGDSQNEVHAISFNGSTFSDIDTISVGSATDSFPTMARLTSTSFAMFGNIEESLRHFTLSGGALAETAGVAEDLSSSDNGAYVCEFDDNKVSLNSSGGSFYALQQWTYTEPA